MSESHENKQGISRVTRDVSEHRSIVPYPKDTSESLKSKQEIFRYVSRDVSEHKATINISKEQQRTKNNEGRGEKRRETYYK